MTDQREQEQMIRERRDAGLSLGYGVLADEVADTLLSLLDRERKQTREWRDQKAELEHDNALLLEALERLASIFPGTGEDVMRARALLARHKEQA